MYMCMYIYIYRGSHDMFGLAPGQFLRFNIEELDRGQVTYLLKNLGVYDMFAVSTV